MSVIDLQGHRQRAIMRRVEGIAEGAGVQRHEGEDDESFEMRVLEAVVAVFKARTVYLAEESRHAAMRALPLRLTAGYRWMHRVPLRYVYSICTVTPRVAEQRWHAMLDGARHEPIAVTHHTWRSRRSVSPRGDRYLVLEPEGGWDGIEWEDLAHAYDCYFEMARPDA